METDSENFSSYSIMILNYMTVYIKFLVEKKSLKSSIAILGFYQF
jgi:hypothetical protein